MVTENEERTRGADEFFCCSPEISKQFASETRDPHISNSLWKESCFEF